MNIDHFCTFPHGGAGTAARRLHERLLDEGVSSRFRYWKDELSQRLDGSFQPVEFQQRSPNSNWIQRKIEKRRVRQICKRYDRHLAQRPENFELFSIPWSLQKSHFDFAQLDTDVLHLHWMSFFVDYPSFFASIPNNAPIVWSLHDMNPLTGGCHYSSGCSRFTVGCGRCPQINQAGPRDVSFYAYRSKRRTLREKTIHIVTPNHWLSELAQHSHMFPEQTEYHVIRLGLDESVFVPIDQLLARRKLGLAEDALLIAFGADDIENYRKGFHHLLSALKLVNAQRPVECLVFGSGQLPQDQSDLPRFHEFGFVSDPQRQALIYSAADVFVMPSREDNQPQTGLEAMACGTPVVGFRAGGIPEYVIPNETGLLASMGNEREMATAIVWLLDHVQPRQAMAEKARKMIESSFTAKLQATRYIELYQQIMDVSVTAQSSEHRASARAA